jgi:transcription elongation factor SPT6
VRPDQYFSPDNSFLQNEQDKARKKKEEEKKKAFKPRMIVHPYFQNVSVDDAIKVALVTSIQDLSKFGSSFLGLRYKFRL